MSKYTMQVRHICQNYWLKTHHANYIPEHASVLANGEWNNDFDTSYVNPFDKSRELYPKVSVLVENALNEIFDFSFPLYDPETKTVRPSTDDFPRSKELKTKIIMAYYMYEIGQETIALWKYHLEETLNRIMPYYNEFYKSLDLVQGDPLENYDLYDSSDRNTTNDTKTNNKNETTLGSKSKQVFQDTPTNRLGDTDYATNITDVATSGGDTSTDTGTSNGTSHDVYNRHVHGLSNYSKMDMLERYRRNILNIDNQVIVELKNLFMLVF